MQEIIQLDQSIFLTLNGLHANWLDPIIYLLTQTWFWLPLYLLIVYIIIKKYRKKSYIPLLVLILAVTLSDQTCNLIKNTTERPRPSREIALQDQVHLYQKDDGNFYRGGVYGFPSAHSSNSMVLAVFILFFIANKKRWIIIAAFCWSLFLGYTRIYLGVHYPFDVLTGFTLGFIISYPLFRWAEKRVIQ